MDRYIFADNQSDHELRRLQRIEVACDTKTQNILGKTGVARGWACLEVGAGGGSILHWLGGRVGIEGRAVGVDRNTTYLRRFTAAPFEIIEGNVLEVRRPSSFDLIHARYVLIHNPDAQAILAHMKSLLRPGGHLVIEEPDFESADWIDDDYGDCGKRVNRAICAMFSNLSLDPGYGKRLPLAVSRSGLRVQLVEATAHLELGTGPVATLMAESATALWDKYLSTGETTESDIDRYIEGTRDPASCANYYSTVSVLATNPITAPQNGS